VASKFDEPSAEGYRAVLGELTNVEEAIGRHCEGLADNSWRPTPGELAEALQRLADQVTATRRTIEAMQQTEREERRRLRHDMRGALNAIAGWTHILRLEKNPSERVARAADVLDRNVRALTVVIESAER
jgi:uncharacterized protein YukE